MKTALKVGVWCVVGGCHETEAMVAVARKKGQMSSQLGPLEEFHLV
jgi:hypothetical protein